MRWAKARIFTVVRRAEDSSKEIEGLMRRLVNICGEALLAIGLLLVLEATCLISLKTS